VITTDTSGFGRVTDTRLQKVRRFIQSKFITPGVVETSEKSEETPNQTKLSSKQEELLLRVLRNSSHMMQNSQTTSLEELKSIVENGLPLESNPTRRSEKVEMPNASGYVHAQTTSPNAGNHIPDTRTKDQMNWEEASKPISRRTSMSGTSQAISAVSGESVRDTASDSVNFHNRMFSTFNSTYSSLNKKSSSGESKVEHSMSGTLFPSVERPVDPACESNHSGIDSKKITHS